MAVEQHLYSLQGKVQHYSWGGFEFIPRLLGTGNPEHKPFAEYWLGAHPNFPGMLSVGGTAVPLNEFIKNNPVKVLGESVVERFRSLPFLLKVLDVRQMLSIQVHPSKASAEVGFERENALGIAVTAANRNYKDDNHKPELMVALSDFWLLHGFKPAALLQETLSAIPEFSILEEEFEKDGYKGLYEKVMLMEQELVNEILEPIASRILPLYINGELLKSQEDFWAARAVDSFCKDGNYDRGIFSIYFFNLVYLKKGEGIFQPAQLPHAYLEGQNIEIMANSDNVLRAGLTDKYIDVAELIKHVKFEETVPDILGATSGPATESHFATSAPEFELSQYRLKIDGVDVQSLSAEIILVLSGNVQLHSGEEQLNLSQGEAALVVAGTGYSVNSTTPAEVFRASVPEIKI